MIYSVCTSTFDNFHKQFFTGVSELDWVAPQVDKTTSDFWREFVN